VTNKENKSKSLGEIVLLTCGIIMIVAGIFSLITSFAPRLNSLIPIGFGVFFTALAIRGMRSHNNVAP